MKRLPRNLTGEELQLVYQFAATIKGKRPKSEQERASEDLRSARKAVVNARSRLIAIKEGTLPPQDEDLGCEHGHKTCATCAAERLSAEPEPVLSPEMTPDERMAALDAALAAQ